MSFWLILPSRGGGGALVGRVGASLSITTATARIRQPLLRLALPGKRQSRPWLSADHKGARASYFSSPSTTGAEADGVEQPQQHDQLSTDICSSPEDASHCVQDDEYETVARLSKWIAHQRGVSRRQAERWIRNGKVSVRGIPIESSAATIPLEDLGSVSIQGKRLLVSQDSGSNSTAAATSSNEQQHIRTRVWLVHKLAGELVTENDPKNRPSVMDRLVRGGVGRSKKKKSKNVHLKPIGRLDMNTTGLLLVTNDGAYARDMELPATQLHRVYKARVHGRLAQYKLQAMRHPVTVNGVRYAPMKVELADTRKRPESTNQWLHITCTEGKNRQVRKVLQHFGLVVTRLMRLSYGDYQLQSIPPGMAIEVPVKPIERQKHRGPLFGATGTDSSTTASGKRKKRGMARKGRGRSDDDNVADESPSSPAVQWVRSVPT